MGYYDEWDEGREYVELPTEEQIIDWNEANDYVNEGDDYNEPCYCDECGVDLEPSKDPSDMCMKCMNEYDKRHPHPLDIAEREEMEDRSAGLEEPWWAYR